MNDLVIVGAGGLGREVAWMVERINQVNPKWNLLGFIDDSEKLKGSIVNGYPVLGSTEWLNKNKFNNLFAVCAIGASKVRKAVVSRLENVKFATLIDPMALISDKVKIGEGSIICANSVLTVDITIGLHNIINIDCTIGHDAILQDFVTLYPSVNISGNTFIGECVEMGTGSQIIQGVKVGEDTIVGAGAVIVKDLPRKCTAVGVPAKPIKFSTL